MFSDIPSFPQLVAKRFPQTLAASQISWPAQLLQRVASVASANLTQRESFREPEKECESV